MISPNPCVNVRRHLIKDGEHKGEHDGAQADDGYLCRSCTRRLEQRIAELPALCSWLHANLARNGSASQLVTGSREAPVPISLTVVALLEWPARICVVPDPISADRTPSIPAVLDSWIRLVLEEHRPRLAGPRKPTVDVMALWLLARMPWLVEQRWVDELALEMDRLHAAINVAAPYWPMRDKPRPTPCPKCELRGLVWNSRWFECDPRLGGCGVLLSQAEYDVLTQRWAVWAQDQGVAV